MNINALEEYMIMRGEQAPRSRFARITKMSPANATYKFQSGNLSLREAVAVALYYGMSLEDFVRIFLDDVYELE